MLEKEFKPDKLYGKIVRYYIDRKGYDKSKANSIAQKIVKRETERRICKTKGCGHFAHDHIRNTGVCLISTCSCASFTNKEKTTTTHKSTTTNNTFDENQTDGSNITYKTEIMIN